MQYTCINYLTKIVVIVLRLFNIGRSTCYSLVINEWNMINQIMSEINKQGLTILCKKLTFCKIAWLKTVS